MNMLAGQLIKEINGLVRILSKDETIKVEFEGNQAKTDGKTVTLPVISMTEYLSRKKVSATRGLVDHECGHIRHTDIEVMEIASKRINSEMLCFLLNVIEDCRINSLVSTEMPGAAMNLDQLAENIIDTLLKDIEAIESKSLLSQPEWYQNKSKKFWGPLSIYLLSLKEGASDYDDLDKLIDKIPKSIIEKSMKIVTKIPNTKDTYQSLDLASQSLHLFGIKPEELSEEEKELIKQIIQFLSKILTSEIAKKIIKEDEGTIGAKVDGREENSKPEKTLKSEKYIILTNEYDVVEASKHKKTMKDDPIHKSQLIRVFQDMLQTECKGFRTVSDTGKRLDSKSLVKAFQGYPNVFLEKTSDKDIDTAIGVLVDASGSMGGIPMALAAKASYELASALQSFPIALEVAYFQTKWSPSTYRKLMKKYPDIFKKGSPPYQSWEEGYRVWPNGLFIVKDFNQSINERRNYFKGMEDVAQGANADGESLLEFSYRLERRPESKKIMIVLSDGYPACGVGYPAEDDFLRQSINNIIDRGIDLGGIGILSDCVEKFYPICSVVNDINQLPSSLSDLCNKMLRSSMRRAS